MTGRVTVPIIRSSVGDVTEASLYAFRPFLLGMQCPTEYFVPAIDGTVLWQVYPCSECGKWYASLLSCPYAHLSQKWLHEAIAKPSERFVWAACHCKALGQIPAGAIAADVRRCHQHKLPPNSTPATVIEDAEAGAA